MKSIKTETLLISSKYDPFLDKNCVYNSNNETITSIYTENGGHVGFLSNSLSDFYWLEKQIISFLEK